MANKFIFTYDMDTSSTTYYTRSAELKENLEKNFMESCQIASTTWLIYSSRDYETVFYELDKNFISTEKRFLITVINTAIWNNCISSNEKIKQILNK